MPEKEINMKTVVYSKLVKDKIPPIIESNGKTTLIKMSSGAELLELLKRKPRERSKNMKKVTTLKSWLI